MTELLDADSIGMNALLAGMAQEADASIIFTSEHSDKTRGSIREMHRATEMMVLARDRPYAKDLGIDLLVLKEKGAGANRRSTMKRQLRQKGCPMRSPMTPKATSGSGSKEIEIVG